MVDTWATVADVLTYAKATVQPADVTAAQATIDLVAGRLPADAERIGTRDQYWLKLAVAYQAAWLIAQPDAFERLEAQSVGGRQGTTLPGDALTVAPFAKWALRRVSWLKSRSLHVRAPYESADPRREVYGEDDDNVGIWVPIGG